MSKNNGRIQSKITIYDKVVLEVLDRSTNLSLVLSTFDKSVNKYFESENLDPQFGAKVQIFKPGRLKTYDGPEITEWNEINEDSYILTVKQIHVPINFSIENLMYDMKNLEDRVIKPAVNAIVEKQERDAIAELTTATGFFVGSATEPLTEDVLNSAASILTKADAPNGQDDRFAVLNSTASSQLKKSMKSTFNPAKTVSDLFSDVKTDFRAYGFACMDSNYLPYHQSGTACNVDNIVIANLIDSARIKVTGLTKTLNPGDKFVITDSSNNAVMFSTDKNRDTGLPMGFSVVSVAGDVITFSPEIKTEDSHGLNFNVSRGLKAGDGLIFAMTAGESAVYSVAYSKYSPKYVSFPASRITDALKNTGAKVITKTDEKIGDSISMWSDASLEKFSQMTRFDKFYGFKVSKPEHCIVLISNTKEVVSSMGDIVAKGLTVVSGK